MPEPIAPPFRVSVASNRDFLLAAVQRSLGSCSTMDGRSVSVRSFQAGEAADAVLIDLLRTPEPRPTAEPGAAVIMVLPPRGLGWLVRNKQPFPGALSWSFSDGATALQRLLRVAPPTKPPGIGEAPLSPNAIKWCFVGLAGAIAVWFWWVLR